MSLITLDDAIARVLERVPSLPAETVPIGHALGLVSAGDVLTSEPIPPFANSAVDGFAVRAADVAKVPVELEVIATVAAGDAPGVTVDPMRSARIMTGAVIPDGADAVVMVEDTAVVPVTGSGQAERVMISAPVAVRANVRPRGDDLPAGAVAVPQGCVITPARVGLLATLGLSEVSVIRRPRVGVISTGDELVAAGSALRPGQIRDSNRVMLLALCEQAGFDGVDLGLIGDDQDAIEAALVSASRSCDAVITSGGVSMGDFDYVKAVLRRIGDMDWMQIAIKPAKPFAFGTIGSAPVFGLPGNPVSSLVSFELLARTGINAMGGHGEPRPMRWPAVAGCEMRRRTDGKVHFVRVSLKRSGGDLVAMLTGAQGSHQLAASAGADALAVLPDGDAVQEGAPLDVIPLR